MRFKPNWGVLAGLFCSVPLLAQEFTFKEAQRLLIEEHGSVPYLSPLSDFNGDNIRDFISGNSVYLGLGDGTFSRQLITQEPIAVLGVGDVDGDGVPDLLAAYPYYTGLSVGQGGISEMQVRLGSVDRSGMVSFEVSHTYALRDLGQPIDVPALTWPADISDLNNDGTPDLIAHGVVVKQVQNSDGSFFAFDSLVFVALGIGGGEFSDFVSYAASEHDSKGVPLGETSGGPVAVYDLNKDGFLDLVMPVIDDTSPGWVSILLNDGKGGFLPPHFYATYPKDDNPVPNHVSVADVDADGDPDLVVGYRDHHGVSILFNAGNGTFDSGIDIPTDTSFDPWDVTAIDVNQSGELTLVVLAGGIELVFSFMDPIKRVHVLPADIGGGQMRLADLDSDGLIDLVLMNSGICERLNEPCVIQINLGHLSSRFLRGDANSDGTVNLSDAVFILSYLFQSGSTPSCLDSADVDDNGSVEITDAIYLLAHLFLGGPAPSKPFPGAGQDPTQDSLICLQ